jgi:hypothetical protein
MFLDIPFDRSPYIKKVFYEQLKAKVIKNFLT